MKEILSEDQIKKIQDFSNDTETVETVIALVDWVSDHVLDELDEINVCVAYELKGKEIDYFPAAVEDQLNVKPVYKKLEGWKSKTQGIKKFDDLPNNAKIYVKAIEEFTETKISSVSTSPERKDTILLVDPFNY